MNLEVPPFKVVTTENRGLTPEELAEQCADKLIFISDNASEEVKEQARAYRKNLISVLTHFMKRTVRNDRVTVYNAIIEAGYPDLAEHIRRL
jgi:hypothetical protein